jgi:hypothetical protein
MCVVLEKLGSASFRESTLEVFISMNAMEGRRRTIWEEGYLRSSSRSRYLFFISGTRIARGNMGGFTLPRMLSSVEYPVSRAPMYGKANLHCP